jgi:hypothetical protein
MQQQQRAALMNRQQRMMQQQHQQQQQQQQQNMNNSNGSQGPQTPPTAVGSPNPGNNNTTGSPEGEKKMNHAVALYQRRQVSHALQQQQQAQAQAQAQQHQQHFVHQPPPQKRQRTDDVSQPQASPQMPHTISPHLMNQQDLAMQQRLQQQQRFDQQQQIKASQSPQMNRNALNQQKTPQQTPQQVVQQANTQRMAWNPTDIGSPSNIESPMHQQQQQQQPPPPNNSVISFDLERFMMGDTGDFGEMFASTDENADQNLLMAGDGGELDPFGGGFLASMGGGIDLDSGVNVPAGTGGGNNAASNSHLQPYADLSGHTNKVSTVSFSVDGQLLASAGHDKNVMIWSVQEKKMLYKLEGHKANITCARWSADNRNLIATSSYDKTLHIWDVGSAISVNGDSLPKHLVKLDCRAQVTAVDFAPDRPDTICSLDAEGELKVWNLKLSNCEKSLKMVSINHTEWTICIYIKYIDTIQVRIFTQSNAFPSKNSYCSCLCGWKSNLYY